MALDQHAQQLFSIAAIVFGLMAAYYWFKASTAKISEQNNRHHPGTELFYDDPDRPGQSIYVVATAMEQSRLNKIAAIHTALALVCQALASLLK